MKLNAPNLAIIFLAATTVGLGIQLFQARQQLAEARTAPTLEVKRTEFRTSGAPAPIVSNPTASAAPAGFAADPLSEIVNEAGPGGGPGGPGNRGQGGARFAAQMAELLKDPEFAAAWKIEQAARIEERYGDLFKQLNLPPDQLAALKDLLIERENAGRDVWASAAAQGLNPREARDQLRQLTADLQAEVDANIEARFGASTITALDTYNSSASQRAAVNTINQRFTTAGMALNPSQSQQLTRILADTGTQSGRTVLITDATISRAQAVLMPAQVETLKKYQAEQQARQVIAEKTRAAREQAQANRNRNN